MTHKKKKNIKKHKKRRDKKYTIKNKLFFIAIFLMIAFLGFGYYNYIYKVQKHQDADTLIIENQKSTKRLMDKMKKMLEVENNKLKLSKIDKKIDKNQTKIKKVPKVSEAPKVKKIIKKDIPQKVIIKKKELKQNYLSEVHDYKNSLKYTKNKKQVIKKAIKYKGKPKLAIIIDDVSFLSQVEQIQKIPFKVTPSFFPPTKTHPNTIKLSHRFKFAMIHLPLEAMDGYMHPEPRTLLASDSKQTISKRINTIYKEFPNIHYYNNHTGSKFTSNARAMKDLISVMKNDHIHFVDSRTTADTKAGIVSKALHVRLLSRDVFLDNVAQKKEILKQLKRAVALAKKNGFAIAIGHPHKNTLYTLINAKKYLKDVKLVYVNEL